MNWTLAIQIASGAGTALMGLGTLIGIIAWVWRKIVPTHRLENEISGLGDRLGAITDHLKDQDTTLGRIEHEVFSNSGNSMRDRIEQTARDVAELHGRMDSIQTLAGVPPIPAGTHPASHRLRRKKER